MEEEARRKGTEKTRQRPAGYFANVTRAEWNALAMERGESLFTVMHRPGIIPGNYSWHFHSRAFLLAGSGIRPEWSAPIILRSCSQWAGGVGGSATARMPARSDSQTRGETRRERIGDRGEGIERRDCGGDGGSSGPRQDRRM